MAYFHHLIETMSGTIIANIFTWKIKFHKTTDTPLNIQFVIAMVWIWGPLKIHVLES